MNHFRNFMYGRYGIDRLSQVLLGVTCLITFTGTLLNSTILISLSYIPLLLAIFRALSKDIGKRSSENRKMMELWQKLKGKREVSKTHKLYKCPSCGQTIRVPKGKGKIAITCPKCRTEFIKRT